MAMAMTDDVEDAEFEARYSEAVKSGDWESIARNLSARLRQMDKRAKAANVRADRLSALTAAKPVTVKPTHRHKKRGTEYVLLGLGKMQAEHWYLPGAMEAGPSVDMREVAIYHKADDPTELWVRPREEFEDGRFEPLSQEHVAGESEAEAVKGEYTSEAFTIPTISVYALSDMIGKELLLITSYCGDDDLQCTDARPCHACLGLSNVFRVERDGSFSYVRMLAPEWNGEKRTMPTAPTPELPESAKLEVVAFLGKVQEVLTLRFPFCRDCADHGGTCPRSGLPCDLDAAFGELKGTLEAHQKAIADRDAEIKHLREMFKLSAADVIERVFRERDFTVLVAELRSRIAELEKALEPFARHIDDMKFDLDNEGKELPDDQTVGWVYVTNGDFRRARAALHSNQKDQSGSEGGA